MHSQKIEITYMCVRHYNIQTGRTGNIFKAYIVYHGNGQQQLGFENSICTKYVCYNA